MKYILILACLLLIQNSKAQNWKVQLDSTLTNLSEKQQFHGQILLFENDEIVFSKNYGINKNENKQSPIETHTSFRLYNLSQPITAVAILILAERGQLSLNDRIPIFFPELNYPNVTVKDLLLMKSGLPDLNSLLDKYANQRKFITNKSIINILSRSNIKTNDIKYCNNDLNYILLASIIEKVSGYDYGAFLQSEIFNKAGMTKTYNGTQANIESARKKGINNENFIQTSGAQSIYSTATDLMKFNIALRSGKILVKEFIENGSYFPPENSLLNSKYNFGWKIDSNLEVLFIKTENEELSNIYIQDNKRKRNLILIHPYSNKNFQSIYNYIQEIWGNDQYSAIPVRKKGDLDYLE